MSSPTWQDRRGMFQPGKVVHEPARRTSQDAGQSKAAKPGGLSTLAASAATGAESATRFIYRPGKEVHEPSRKKSMSESKPTPPVPAAVATSPTTSTASTATTSTVGGGAAAGRRRSSASSQGSGRYSGLLSNLEHAQRRQTFEDMKAPGGFGGLFGGLLNKGPEKK